MIPDFYRISRATKEARNVYTLEMAPSDVTRPFFFAPGQFNMLYAFGKGEVPISISGDPARPTKLVHTIRARGAVTKALCALRPGDAVGVRGPFGAPWPLGKAEGKDVVLVAGGLGFAPLRPVLLSLLASRKSYRKIAFICGNRRPGDFLFKRQLARWQQRSDIQLEVTVDVAGGDWRGHVGMAAHLISRLQFDPRHAVAMICGPEILMRFTVWELLKRGMEPQDIFLSMERNMNCGLGLCGHCQLGPFFVCKDGPVFSFERIKDWFDRREV